MSIKSLERVFMGTKKISSRMVDRIKSVSSVVNSRVSKAVRVGHYLSPETWVDYFEKSTYSIKDKKIRKIVYGTSAVIWITTVLGGFGVLTNSMNDFGDKYRENREESNPMKDGSPVETEERREYRDSSDIDGFEFRQIPYVLMRGDYIA